MIREVLTKASSAFCWYLCRCMRVDRRKVLFTSYYGRGYGDSPAAIAEALHSSAPEIKLLWETSSPAEAATLPDYIHPVRNQGFARIYALSTAAVWVDNCRKGAHFKRKNQKYMQTWHGFALKRIEGDTENTLSAGYIAQARRDSQQIDLLISDSRFMTELYRRAFWYDHEILECGLPRNDRLVRNPTESRRKVRTMLQLAQDEKLVLYAPTFREDKSLSAYSLDFERLKQTCERRFGGSFTTLLRLHPNIAALAPQMLKEDQRVVNATDYPDSQELLEAADVLITDYSSIMFDFMLTGRPCFQFATDIEAYKNDRNFYIPLDQLPFALATNNDELEQAIARYEPAEYRRKTEDFIRTNGIIADGNAAGTCAGQILAWLRA